MSYTYAASSREVESMTSSDGVTATYTRDGSLVTGVTYSGTLQCAVTRAFNSDFLVVTESVNGASALSYTYDPDGLLTGAGPMTLTHDAARRRHLGGDGE